MIAEECEQISGDEDRELLRGELAELGPATAAEAQATTAQIRKVFHQVGITIPILPRKYEWMCGARHDCRALRRPGHLRVAVDGPHRVVDLNHAQLMHHQRKFADPSRRISDTNKLGAASGYKSPVLTQSLSGRLQ